MTNGRSDQTRLWARVGFLLTIASLAAACTTEESSQPGPTLTSVATSTSSTTIPETTTTTEAPTTTLSTTTTEAPTTTAAAPTGPIDASIPLLTGGDDGNWMFLGAWQVDHWDNEFGEIDAPSIEGSPTFAVSGLGFAQTSGVVGPNGEACVDGREGPAMDVSVPPPEPPGFGFGAVALPSSWPLRPRPAALIAGGVPAYQQLGVEAFAGESVDASLGSVAQIVVVDLDGDGDDEAIVAFERVENPDTPGSAGDLAAMLLVDTGTRSSQTIISNTVIGVDNEENFFPVIQRFRALDIADLNGDGRMEVVIHAWHYEGASVIVYEYDGTTLTEVLATGCGL